MKIVNYITSIVDYLESCMISAYSRLYLDMSRLRILMDSFTFSTNTITHKKSFQWHKCSTVKDIEVGRRRLEKQMKEKLPNTFEGEEEKNKTNWLSIADSIDLPANHLWFLW